MTNLKNLVLGSAAVLLATGTAGAADLPVKAKAVEYVRVCSLYGAGFWYIPGTDTCMRVGGYLRVDTTFNGTAHGTPAWANDQGQQNRYRDYFYSRSRFQLIVDTRTATEYGVVRTFAQGDFQFTTLGSSRNPNVLATNLGNNGQLLDTPGGGYVAVEYVFIQFAGFTFGKSSSAYSTPWNGFPGNINSNLLGGNNTDTGVNNIQYTAEFGNGVSASIGLDDPTVWNRTAVYNLAAVPGVGVNGTGSNAYGGTHAPDIVGRFRIDQAWGLFQISGAAHLVNASYNILGASAAPTNLSEISGHPDDKWGGSVMAALQIKNLPTGAGDDIKIDASYAVGTTKNVIATSGNSPSFAMFSGTGVAGAYQSVGFGATTDAVYLPGPGGTNGLQLTKAWGVRGAFNHNWDPYWSTSLFGSFSAVRYDGNSLDTTTAKGAYCAAFGASHAGLNVTYTCDPNFNVSQLGVVTRWTPVKNLTFSGEVQWFHLDQKMGNGPGLTTSTSAFTATAPKPAATYQFKDQDTVLLQVRAQRNF